MAATQMASAGLLRILHSGLQDERLLPPKGQPRTDSFLKAFVRAGRFTTEWVQVDFDNQPAFGSTAKATLPRRGHLITRAFLVTTMPDISTQQKAARAWCLTNGKTFVGPTFGWTNSIGHALIQQTQFLIGATAIDTLDGRLMEVLDEFHTPLEKVTTVNRLLGRYDSGFAPSSNGYNVTNQQVVTPLPFWFARGDPSDAFPIDAVGTDAVQLSVTFNDLGAIYTTGSRTIAGSNGSDTGGSAQYAKAGCIDVPNGTTLLSQLQSSPFYYSDPINGTFVYGLTGDTSQSQKVSQVPAISMSLNYNIQSAYLLLEYVYLDKPEANRIRLGDLSYPIVQHYASSYKTNGAPAVRIPMRIPNPTREIYFMCHRTDADLLNAPFLATRDLSAPGGIAPWWPDASGLNTKTFLPLVPAYSSLDSEPITSLSLVYEGRLIRYATDAPVLFRSILSSFEQRKTPWHNKYYYHLPFGTQHEEYGLTNFMGHANLDKIPNIELALNFKPFAGSVRVSDVPSYTVYIWAETYAILRVYGGRAGLLFGY